MQIRQTVVKIYQAITEAVRNGECWYWLGFTAAISSASVILILTISGSFPLVLGIILSLLIFGSSVLIIKAMYMHPILRLTQKMCKTYKVAYDENYRRLTDYLSCKNNYYNDISVFTEKNKDILPAQVAMLSKAVKNGVRAPVMQVLLDFSNAIKNNDTIFLIRVNHDNPAWHVAIAGRAIAENQAMFVFDKLKEKIKDLSEKDELIKKIEKILN